MAALVGRQVFQPGCPQGGSWTACGYGSHFVGCCLKASAACVNDCSEDDLKPASFVKEHYSDVTGSSCPDGSLWYTCQNTNPTFMGCCTSDACQQNGCPASDLRATYLSEDSDESAPYSAIPDPSSIVGHSSFRTSTPTHSPVSSTAKQSTSSPTTTGTAPASAPAPPTHIAPIAGGVIGGLAFITALVALIVYLFRRRQYRRGFDPKSALSSENGSPLSSDPHSTLFAVPDHATNTTSPPAHNPDLPPSNIWHPSGGIAQELPSLDMIIGQQVMDEGSGGLGTYGSYRPGVGGKHESHELFGGEKHVSYELGA